ncbi:hypothetical protein [Thermosynechococcus vestitus]|nr:hypothetical protein [Thermosynechococcus vestitus]
MGLWRRQTPVERAFDTLTGYLQLWGAANFPQTSLGWLTPP